MAKQCKMQGHFGLEAGKSRTRESRCSERSKSVKKKKGKRHVTSAQSEATTIQSVEKYQSGGLFSIKSGSLFSIYPINTRAKRLCPGADPKPLRVFRKETEQQEHSWGKKLVLKCALQ